MSVKEVADPIEQLVRQMNLPWIDLECADHLSLEHRKFYFSQQLEQMLSVLVLEYKKARGILGDVSRDLTEHDDFWSSALDQQVKILRKAFTNLEMGFDSALDEPEIIRAQQALWEKGFSHIDPSSEEAEEIRISRDLELETGISKVWMGLRLLGNGKTNGQPMDFSNSDNI